MSEVIPFPQQGNPNQEVLICECGCYTYHITGAGEAVCAYCMASESLSELAGEAFLRAQWLALLKPENAPSPPPKVSSSVVMDDREFVFRRAVQSIDPTKTVVLIAIQDDGKITTCGGVFDDQTRAWLKEIVDAAYEQLVRV